jgi:hypothetical protein
MTPRELGDHEKLQLKKKERYEKKAAYIKEQADAKAAKEAAIAEAKEKMRTNKNATRTVIYPTYKFDERLKVDREVDIPDPNMFFELGYNRTPEDKIKHYRRFWTNELELVEEVMPGGGPFMLEPAYRMEQKNAGLFGGGDDDSENNVSVVSGHFKGMVAIYNEERRAIREEKMIKGVLEIKEKLKTAYDA